MSPGGNLATLDKLPVFGEMPTNTDLTKLFDGLDLEMVWCVRDTPEGSDNTNILHASPDTDSVKVETEHMANFMASRGFRVRREPIHEPPDWHNVDVFVLGTDDKQPSTPEGILDAVVWWAGLVQSWDVLLYGTNHKATTRNKPPERPQCSGPYFGLDGVCMLHGHLMLRDDTRFWEGFFAHMAIELEASIDRVIGGSVTKGLDTKIEHLKKAFKDARLVGDDVELFLPAASLVCCMRNMFVHSPRHPPRVEFEKRSDQMDKLLREFTDVVSSQGKSDLLGPGPCVGHKLLKYHTRIAIITRFWAYNLGRMVESGRRKPYTTSTTTH